MLEKLTIRSKVLCALHAAIPAAQGAQGVILGCTELTMSLQPGDGGLPGFDTTALHAMAAVDFCLS